MAAAHLPRVPLSTSRERDPAVPTLGVSRDSREATPTREGAEASKCIWFSSAAVVVAAVVRQIAFPCFVCKKKQILALA